MLDFLKIRKNFGLKISIYVITAVIIIFLAVLFYNYKVSERLILESNEENVANISSSIINQANSVVVPMREVAECVASVLEYSDTTEEEIKHLLKETVRNNNDVYGCAVAFEPYMFKKDKKYSSYYFYQVNDDIKYSENGRDGFFDYFSRDWYINAKKMKEGVFSEPYNDTSDKKIRMVTYSLPFYKRVNGKKEFYGVIAIDISLDHLNGIFSNIKIFKTGLAFLLSSKGTFIVHRNKAFYREGLNILNLPEENYPEHVKKEITEKVLSGKSEQLRIFSNSIKKEVFVYYRPLETTGWILCIVIPVDELYSKLNTTTLNLLIIGIIGYILTFCLVVILCSRAVSPLKKLAAVTAKIGLGDFYAELPKSKTADEIGLLSDSFMLMQENLIKYIKDLKEVTSKQERTTQELAIGREMQQSMLPHELPGTKEIDILANLIPAKEVAGDLYDYFFLDKNRWCFAIGDVSGKGVPSALIMAVTCTLLRAKASLNLDTSKIVSEINSELCKNNESAMFVTFILFIVDIKTGKVEYCNAGHNPPLIKSGDNFNYLKTLKASPPLGILEEAEYVSMHMDLKKGDIVLLYTDGIPEAINEKEEEFTEQKLLEIAEANKNESLHTISLNILNAVEKHASGQEQSDDITLLLLRYNG